MNAEERESAFSTLKKWIAEGTLSEENRVKDVTFPIVVEKEKVFFDDEGVWGKITQKDAWGDVTTDFLPRHLQKLNIKHGDYFKAEFGGKQFGEALIYEYNNPIERKRIQNSLWWKFLSIC